MIIKDLKECREFKAGDASSIRELLHPDKGPYAFRYSLAHAVVGPGSRTLRHRLSGSEVYYVIAGSGLMHIDAETAEVRAGHAVYIPPGAVQFIENPGDSELAFLCLVDPAWQADAEDVLEEPGA